MAIITPRAAAPARQRPADGFTTAPILRLDIRIKLLGFLAVVVLAFLFENPGYNFSLVLLVGLIAWSIRFPLQKIRALLLPLTPLFMLIILLTGFTFTPDRFHLASSRAVIWHLLPGRGPEVTWGGMMLGLTFLLRIAIMATASALFAGIAPLDDLLLLLQKLKLPYEVSFIILTAIRFIPTLDRKRMLILDAGRARGTDFKRKGLVNWFRAQITVMIPLMINSILMADSLSMAMLNRGFGYARTRTGVRNLSLKPADYWTAGAILLVLGYGIYLRFYLKISCL